MSYTENKVYSDWSNWRAFEVRARKLGTVKELAAFLPLLLEAEATYAQWVPSSHRDERMLRAFAKSKAYCLVLAREMVLSRRREALEAKTRRELGL